MENNLFADETPILNIEQPPQPPPAEPKKEKRGRPRKEQQPKAEKMPVNDEEKLKAKLADFQRNDTGATAEPPPAGADLQNSVQGMGQLITGTIMLEVIDFLFPRGIKFIYTFFEENAQYINIEDIKMSGAQKKELEPIADVIAKTMFADVPPHMAFFIMLGINYFNNIGAAMEKANEKAEKIKADNYTYCHLKGCPKIKFHFFVFF